MKKINKLNQKHTEDMYKNAYTKHIFNSNGGTWYFPAKAAMRIMHNRYQDFCVCKNLQGLQPVTIDTARIDLMGSDIFPNFLYYEDRLYNNKVEFKLYNN